MTESPALDTTFRTEVGSAMRSAALEMVPLIRSEAAEIERIGEMTPAVLDALQDAGVFTMAMPPELGGTALGASDVVEVVSALAKGDGSVAWMAFVAAGMRMVSTFPQPLVDDVFALRDSWAGPLCIGASVFSTSVGDARKVDGGWMVSGTWRFGSGSKHTAWAAVGVEFETPHGPGRGMAVLPREDFRILDDWKVMGLSGTSSNGITTDGEVFVPDHRIVDLRELDQMMGSGPSRYTGLAYQTGMRGTMITISVYTISIALGMAEGALESFTEQARTHRPFNLPYPTVADMPTVQVVAGKARAMINIAGTVIRSHAAEVDRRAVAGKDFSPEEESEMTLDLVYAARLCEEAINSLQVALGSSTMRLSNPIQRFVRDIRVLTSHGAIRLDPLSEINGRAALGLEPFAMFAGGLAKVGG
ncbi:acyl-CoA dehydrogenase family protein [Streptomyces mangrovisoli]|uniref:Oxidoreductase n=1 Tax=Streptomyces mangrovisoli TaxID=1428628 RepID=A0A1J4NV49_9ACTN|nr:acyl-CoA dehydrogenase family protein [Streptomyces mangrovisoli]OIJ65006.1 oxidoreductase [Streptomyces mangrovisoli]